MSILRDVKELGLGHGHFLITGNDIPSGWSDPTSEEEYIEERARQDSMSNLDSEKGWFDRRRFVEARHKPVGFVGDEAFYHVDQTTKLSTYIQWISEDIDKDLSNFVKKVEIEGLSTKSKLDKEFDSLKKSILQSIDITYSLMKESTAFVSEPSPGENQVSFRPIDIDDDIPF